MDHPLWEDEPVPASELKELEVGKQILSCVYGHGEHLQGVEQVAGVAGVVTAERALSFNADEPRSPPSSWVGSFAHRTPSLPLSAIESESSVSQLRLSSANSTEENDTPGRSENDEELLGLPPTLDSALRINMCLQNCMKERIQEVSLDLNRIAERQKQIKEEILDLKAVRDYEQKGDGTDKLNLRITHFCVPYFKNRSGMPAPMNEDAKTKVKNGNIDLYVTRSRTWLTVEKEQLAVMVCKEWKEQTISFDEVIVKDLERKARSLSRDENLEMITAIEEDIKRCKEHIEKLKATPHEDMCPPRGEQRLDWDRISAQAFDGSRTSDECRLQWENLLHPTINTSHWTEKEDIIIQKMTLQSRNKVPNWDKIAVELRSGRTALQVMQRYVSFIEPTIKPIRWTKQDSDKLLQIVNMLRTGSHIPWSQVHQHFVGVSRTQLQSHWRIIDPDISKGPFTVEEDFILIKGLHVFGLNFENIAHFMPGRLPAQVRDRYKRTILPGLCRRPWTREEDDILIREGSVGSKHWRRMMLELPRHDACQIRCRYHIIQVWQTISGTNKAPPPLFPVSTTLNLQLIKDIRIAMIMEKNVKELVDKSRKGSTLKSELRELEERRILIKERKAEMNLEKMKKVTEKRGRQRGQGNPQSVSLLDFHLTEFFIPYRPHPSNPSLAFKNVQQSMKILSQSLRMKIGEDGMFSDGQLTPLEADIIRSMTVKHTPSEEGGCASDCSACEPVQHKYLPLIPPNKTTVGAFRSLLIHRPKLNDMASKQFVLHRYSKSELMQLDMASKGKRLGKRKSNFTLLPDPNVSEVAVDCTSLASDCDVTRPRNSSEADANRAGGQSDIESQDSSPQEKSNHSPTKIHITSSAKGSEWKKNHPKFWKNKLDATGQREIKAYSRGKSMKSEPQESRVAPVINLIVNNCEIAHLDDLTVPSRSLSAEEDEARKHADDLLFQRMLSIFCWPALMTLALPPHNLIASINTKIETGDVPQPEKKNKPPKILLSKDDLDIKEQDEYISFLNDMELEHLQRKQQSKTNSDQVGINAEEESLDNCDARQEAASSVEGGTLRSFQRRRKLKSLRRSLVMKKVWEGRRSGSLPPRTSDRDPRSYCPRGSRTRDRARKDIMKGRSKMPKPWDLPIDGPLRVQPQVPVTEDDLMAIALSDNATTSGEGSSHSEVPQNIASTSQIPPNIASTSQVLSETAEVINLPVGSKGKNRLSRKKITKVDSRGHLVAPVKSQNQKVNLTSGVIELQEQDSQLPSIINKNCELKASLTGEEQSNIQARSSKEPGRGTNLSQHGNAEVLEPNIVTQITSERAVSIQLESKTKTRRARLGPHKRSAENSFVEEITEPKKAKLVTKTLPPKSYQSKFKNFIEYSEQLQDVDNRSANSVFIKKEPHSDPCVNVVAGTSKYNSDKLTFKAPEDGPRQCLSSPKSGHQMLSSKFSKNLQGGKNLSNLSIDDKLQSEPMVVLYQLPQKIVDPMHAASFAKGLRTTIRKSK